MIIAPAFQLTAGSKSPTLFQKSRIYIFMLGIALVIALVSTFYFGRTSQLPIQQAATGEDWQKQINQSFSFPVKDTNGNTITSITYTISNVTLQNQIIIQGQPAQAVVGKTFFIINLKLINSSNQTVQMNTRDYIRLKTDTSNDLLAPDIHNDPVQVQAISTKYTRLGFPIDSKTKKLTLFIGEITGTKTQIPINF